jgi:hypothetical protein
MLTVQMADAPVEVNEAFDRSEPQRRSLHHFDTVPIVRLHGQGTVASNGAIQRLGCAYIEPSDAARQVVSERWPMSVIIARQKARIARACESDLGTDPRAGLTGARPACLYVSLSRGKGRDREGT